MKISVIPEINRYIATIKLNGYFASTHGDKYFFPINGNPLI